MPSAPWITLLVGGPPRCSAGEMGNSVGKEAQDMGVVVISHVIQSGRSELMALRRRILMMKQDKKGHMIARGEYQDAAQFVVIDPSDSEVFDRLLTLFDKTGDGRVMWKELMVGCACIINASFEDRLLVAMELYDEEKSGQLARHEVHHVIKALGQTCDFFGDPKLSPESAEELVESLFLTKMDVLTSGERLPYKECIHDLAQHPIVETYLNKT